MYIRSCPFSIISLILAAGTSAHATDFSENNAQRRASTDHVIQAAFERANAASWRKVFVDPCTGDWNDKWFLDGEVGTVTNGLDGMTLTAGPEFKNDAHHMVLWTKEEFAGDLRIEYDYTRLDNENRCVTILYIQATGSGQPGYDRDITKWKNERRVPAMRTYYNTMNLYHVSYSAFGNDGKATQSYIRARRYMPHAKGLKGTDLEPDYHFDTLFATGVKHHITVIKKDRELLMRVENPGEVAYCRMVNTELPPVTEGRIGLRHMFTRSARYENVTISDHVASEASARCSPPVSDRAANRYGRR